jgi:hypothetical protein
MRGRTSSVEYVSAIRSENEVITSYGVARFPYTMRSATERARLRTGSKASRRSGTASRKPPPTVATTSAPRKTTVMNAATTATMTVFRRTISRSYRRYFNIAMPIAAGQPMPTATRNA